MKFLKLKVLGKDTLVNIGLEGSKGSNLYFNTMASIEEQAYIHVDESFEEIQKLLGVVWWRLDITKMT